MAIQEPERAIADRFDITRSSYDRLGCSEELFN